MNVRRRPDPLASAPVTPAATAVPRPGRARPVRGRRRHGPSQPAVARVDAVNRLVLLLLGLLCLGAGVVILLAGSGAFDADVAHRAVLTGDWRRFAADHGWFWPVVGVATGLLTLAALWWGLAQLSRDRAGALMVVDDELGDVRLSAAALADAIEAEVAEIPGAQAATVEIVGGRRAGRRRRAPVARISAAVDDHVEIAAFIERIDRVVLAHARQATGRADLRAEALIVPGRPGSGRAR